MQIHMQIKKGYVFHWWHFHLGKVVNSWSADSPLSCSGCPTVLLPKLRNCSMSCYDHLTWHGRINDICVGIRIMILFLFEMHDCVLQNVSKVRSDINCSVLCKWTASVLFQIFVSVIRVVYFVNSHRRKTRKNLMRPNKQMAAVRLFL